jgi:hypothetical protein
MSPFFLRLSKHSFNSKAFGRSVTLTFVSTRSFLVRLNPPMFRPQSCAVFSSAGSVFSWDIFLGLNTINYRDPIIFVLFNEVHGYPFSLDQRENWKGYRQKCFHLKFLSIMRTQLLPVRTRQSFSILPSNSLKFLNSMFSLGCELWFSGPPSPNPMVRPTLLPEIYAIKHLNVHMY